MAIVAPDRERVARVTKAPSFVRFQESFLRALTLGFALISIFATLGIVVVLVVETAGFFHSVSAREFFLGRVWNPSMEPAHFGILPLACGTFVVAIGSALFAFPLGVLTAVYLSEYAHPKVRSLLKPALELLAGIPSVVYGYVALFFITPILKHLIPSIDTLNALSAAIVVGIMVLPLVSSLCEDAISAVPKAMREAGYGLGSTKFEVTAKIVLPGAMSGMAAAFLLAFSRAIGETMAVTLAAGATPNLSLNPLHTTQTMTSAIVNLASGDVSRDGPGYRSIFAVAAALFAVTLTMNIIATRLVRKWKEASA